MAGCMGVPMVAFAHMIPTPYTLSLRLIQVLKKLTSEMHKDVMISSMKTPGLSSLSPEQVRLPNCLKQLLKADNRDTVVTVVTETLCCQPIKCNWRLGNSTMCLYLQVGMLTGMAILALAAYMYYTSPSRKLLLLDLYCFERPKE